MSEAKEVAAQLRKPSGDAGIEMGQMMNESNKIISLGAYDRLSLQNNDAVLEIGMGNGYYVQHILDQAENLTYTGVDYSNTMVEEAVKINAALIEQDQASFHHSGINKIPAQDESFDKIVTVNTMYFWEDPVRDLKELKRVLKLNGWIIIAVRPKGTVKAEFIKYNFNFYSNEEIAKFVREAGLEVDNFDQVPEKKVEFDGVEYDLESLYIKLVKE